MPEQKDDASTPATRGRVRPELTRAELGAILALVGVLAMIIGAGKARDWRRRRAVHVIRPAGVTPYVVDVNSATAAELMLLPGIGEVLAARIVAHREARGPFASIEDLTQVRGVGEKTAAGLAPYARVGEPGNGGAAPEEESE